MDEPTTDEQTERASQYHYRAHIVPAIVWDAVKIGDEYFGGVVVEGSSGMENDLVLIVAYPADSDATTLIMVDIKNPIKWRKATHDEYTKLNG